MSIKRVRWSRADRFEGWRGVTPGPEMSMSLLLSSSSFSFPPSAPDRRSLIGNEPWSRSLSRRQQIATTYRLWRGVSSLFTRFYISPSPPRVYSFLALLSFVYESLRLILGSVEVRAALPLVWRGPLSGPEPSLRWHQDSLIHLEWPCSLVPDLPPHLGKWLGVTDPHLLSTVALGMTDFQWGSYNISFH